MDTDAIQKIVLKITRLLRIAASKPDEPEGQLAAETARKIMDRHGIVVTLEEAQSLLSDHDSAPDPREIWYPVGDYDKRDGWRDILVSSVAAAFDVEAGWALRGGLARLAMRDPRDGDVAYVESAIAYFMELDMQVELATVPRAQTPMQRFASQSQMASGFPQWPGASWPAGVPWPGMSTPPMGPAPTLPETDPKRITAFRRGVVDVLCTRLGSTPPRQPSPSDVSFMVEPAEVVVREERERLEGEIDETPAIYSTALVAQRTFSAPREETIYVPPADIPVDHGFGDDVVVDGPPKQHVLTDDEMPAYQLGQRLGQRISLPRIVRR